MTPDQILTLARDNGLLTQARTWGQWVPPDQIHDAISAALAHAFKVPGTKVDHRINVRDLPVTTTRPGRPDCRVSTASFINHLTALGGHPDPVTDETHAE